MKTFNRKDYSEKIFGCFSAARKNDFIIVNQFAFDRSNKLTLKEFKR